MSIPLRLGLFYAAMFAGIGASSPYMPVWFAHRGLSGVQIGIILALPGLVRIFTGPVLAVWADGFALRRTPLAVLALAVAGGYALLAAPVGFWGWLGLWLVASTCFMAITPLTDVITLARARSGGFNFGWPRGIGSAGFIVGNLGMGVILIRGSPELVVVWITSCALLMMLGARWLLPAESEPTSTPKGTANRWTGIGDLLRDRAFMTAVIAAGLIQSAHAFYYGFSTLTWRQQGIPESLTGVLWGVAVAVEVGFLWFLEPWRRRLGPRNLLVIGGVGAVVRWAAYASAPPLWLLFPLQGLHALSYAATFLATLEIGARLSAPTNASAAQSMSAAVGSLLAGLATLASGWIFDRFGSGGYLLMAAMCVVGVAAALTLYREPRLDA